MDQTRQEPVTYETERLIECAQRLREHLREDPHRPAYHFLPPEAWMNDINGAIYWHGRYHIFYQHNPLGGYWHWMQWGHASSTDLVHWVHHGIALTPTAGGPDRDGCFSGGAFVSREGVPMFIYHGIPEGTCLAASHDDLLLHWEKHPGNPVILVTTPGTPEHGRYVVFDPCAWREGDTYAALIGNRVPGQSGDATSLFKSPDLVHWEHLGPFCESDRRWTEADEDCAVPDFFPLGDEHMLLFCSHLQGSQYYLGAYDGRRFTPRTHAWMSWPGGHLGGARTLLDRAGRRIFFDWVRELRGVDRERTAGWSGLMTVPRILSLGDDGWLRIEPVPELQALRLNRRERGGFTVRADSEMPVDGVQGNCLELALDMEPEGAREFGVKVCCAPDGTEQTAVVYAPASQTLRVDVSRSTLDSGIQYLYYRNPSALDRLPEAERMVRAQSAPLSLPAGESLQLRLFLDHSVLEVFANSRQCLTQRIYPTRRDSLGVRLFATGGSVRVKAVEAWDLASTNS